MNLAGDLAGKHVLVVGGAGFIGSHLSDALADTRLTVLDDLSTGTKANIAHLQGRSDFHFIEGDYSDKDTIEEIVPDVDVIFHLPHPNSQVVFVLSWKNHLLFNQLSTNCKRKEESIVPKEKATSHVEGRFHCVWDASP